MEIVAFITSVLVVLGLLLHQWFKPQSRLRRALKMKDEAVEQSNTSRIRLMEGRYDEMASELDRLNRHVDAMRVLLEKKSPAD